MPLDIPFRPGWLRLVALIVLLATLYLVGRETGIVSGVTTAVVREKVQGAGIWGALAFVAAFSGGLFLHVPGLVFVGAGIAAYGRLLGGLLSFGAAVNAVSVSFLVVRFFGGSPFASMKHPLATRLMTYLDTHPVITVALLRLVLLMSPPLNYALGLSAIRFKDYLAGSALGLALPLTAVSFLFDRLFR